MTDVALRVTHDFHLRPMTVVEATEYLHTKLRVAGCEIPEFVFPIAVCTELWRCSGGWPGILDRIALLALAKAETLPIPIEAVEQPALPSGTRDDIVAAESQQHLGTQPDAPTLYVSHEGKTLKELTFDKTRMLIGRSEHNDIPIPSKFISRNHALLVRHAGTTVLNDLNSTNGTFVNSKRVSNHVLIHNDVIALGQHRIKFVDPLTTQRRELDGIELADTVIMKTLDDMRKLLAKENTAVLPVQSENLPTSGV